MIFTLKSKFQGFGSPENTLEFECDQIEDVVRYFEQFLRGSGYFPKGHLEFVPDPSDITQDDLDTYTENLFKRDSCTDCDSCGGCDVNIDDSYEHSSYYYDVDRNR